jgi:hypothetical protein
MDLKDPLLLVFVGQGPIQLADTGGTQSLAPMSEGQPRFDRSIDKQVGVAGRVRQRVRTNLLPRHPHQGQAQHREDEQADERERRQHPKPEAFPHGLLSTGPYRSASYWFLSRSSACGPPGSLPREYQVG